MLADLARKTRPAWWLPEHRRQRGIGDSGANRYAEVISMVEGRSLAQLSSFVHDIV